MNPNKEDMLAVIDAAGKGISKTGAAEDEEQIARLVRRALAGSWRHDPPPLTLTEPELALLFMILRRTGEINLVWPRLRDQIDPESPVARVVVLHRQQTAIRNALRWQDSRALIRRMRSVGVEPILVKGWAIGRCYPQGARPLGDLDLCVRPEDHAAAERLTSEYTDWRLTVDLKSGCPLLPHANYADLLERSVLVPAEDIEIRVLGPEHHLQLLCRHTLIHGCGRALWVCDIAAALEARPPEFDWGLCLSGPPAQRDAILTALAMAHVLLDASVEGVPEEVLEKCESLPNWLLTAMRRALAQGTAPRAPEPFMRALLRGARTPRRIFEEARLRWCSPIKATVLMGGMFDDAPRLPVQLAYHVQTSLLDRLSRRKCGRETNEEA
jgi:hypothetical protein